MGESGHPRHRQRWSIERDEVYAVLAVVGVAMLSVSGESLSWGGIVGGAIGGAFGTMVSVADDTGDDETKGDSAWWRLDVPDGLELVLLAGGLIAYVLAVDAGWLLSMGEAGSSLLGPSLGTLSVTAWNRTVGAD